MLENGPCICYKRTTGIPESREPLYPIPSAAFARRTFRTSLTAAAEFTKDSISSVTIYSIRSDHLFDYSENKRLAQQDFFYGCPGKQVPCHYLSAAAGQKLTGIYPVLPARFCRGGKEGLIFFGRRFALLPAAAARNRRTAGRTPQYFRKEGK